MVRQSARLLFISLCLAILFAAEQASAVEFVPHRAIYTLALEGEVSASGIAAVEGGMAAEWRKSCSGWSFDYRSAISIQQETGRAIDLATTATTWESDDGKTYRFLLRTRTNGAVLEKIEGVARMPGNGKTGRVTFTSPTRREFDLPADTLFPVAHSMAIVKAAMSGPPPVFRALHVFDGMDADPLYLVNAVIGAPRSKKDFRLPEKSMVGMQPWPVSLAYYSASKKETLPTHEISMWLFANGVADRLIMDFGDFTVRATLKNLNLLPPPNCE
jgi:hypothetical protein